MQKNHIFLIILTTLVFVVSCKKEKEEIIKQHTPCETALEGWSISTIEIPNIFATNLHFPTNQIGYLIGQAAIFKTTDGGQNWQSLQQYYNEDNTTNDDAVTKGWLTDVFFVDENTGFVSGNDEAPTGDSILTGAVLLKTLDGGATWSKQYFEGVYGIGNLHFFDAMNGLAMFTIIPDPTTVTYKLYGTKDGGETWAEIELPGGSDVKSGLLVGPNSIALAVGNSNDMSTIARSFDKGQTWQTLSELEGRCYSYQFLDDKTGFATCASSSILKLLKTTDGGNTWETASSPFDLVPLLHFKNEQAGFLIKPQYDEPTSIIDDTAELLAYEVWETFDGGKKWKKSAISPTCNFLGTPVEFAGGKFATLGEKFITIFEEN